MNPLAAARSAAGRVYHRVRSVGGRRRCTVCGRRVLRFLPLDDGYAREWKTHGFDHGADDLEMLNAEQYACPHCGASDRDRICALYVRQRMANAARPLRLVEFAPSPPLSKMLRGMPELRYRTADLFMENVDDRVDITDMTAVYPDASVDCFLCVHVLEHVSDDRMAMRELARILVPGGWGIVLVPVSRRLGETREEPAPTDVERWRLFGQHDHVRLHTRAALVERLREAGLNVLQLGAADFGAETFERCGLVPSSILYVVEKPPEER